MTAALAVAAAALGLVVGVLLGPVIEQVPEHEALWPLPHLTFDRRAVIVAASAGALFSAAALRFGAVWIMPGFCVFFASLLALSVIDLRHFLLPNRIIYPTIVAVAPFLVLAAATTDGGWTQLGHAALAGGGAFLALALTHLIYPRGMGFGDVRLAGLIGLMLGWLGYRYVVLGLFLGFLLASVIGLVLIVSRVRSRSDAIPFGPFMAAGAVIAAIWGHAIVGTYSNGHF